MTKTILTCVTVVLAVLLTACSSSENNGPMSDVDGTAVVASYEGHWLVGTHNAGDGDMTVYVAVAAVAIILLAVLGFVYMRRH